MSDWVAFDRVRLFTLGPRRLDAHMFQAVPTKTPVASAMTAGTAGDKASQVSGTDGLDKPKEKSAFLHRHLRQEFPAIAKGQGHYIFLQDGRCILDASGGAVVACIGHGDKRVLDAMKKQADEIAYCASSFFTTSVCEALCRNLVNTAPDVFSRAYIVNSGSEAMEAAMKLSRQYFLEKQSPEPERVHFISRRQSYHGITLGALSAGGHRYRRALFEPLLTPNTSQVSPCYSYRGMSDGDTVDDYVGQLARELEDEFIRVGPNRVCAFIAEPIVGAALGCVPAVPGYLEAVKGVCRKYGALLILDEVMCGMGRSGTMHAWQHDGVAPDIQTIGKGLGGGYQPIAGVIVNRRVIDALEQGTGAFVHGHTYQGHPMACAAALQVQHIIQNELLEKVQGLGHVLQSLLMSSVARHPNVGDIRGRGLFWGLEFVQDKADKQPFKADAKVAARICDLGLSEKHCIAIYPGSGSADGILGDHVIVAPPFNVTEKDLQQIVDRLSRLVHDFFAQMQHEIYLN